jgi:hypothetical protein
MLRHFPPSPPQPYGSLSVLFFFSHITLPYKGNNLKARLVESIQLSNISFYVIHKIQKKKNKKSSNLIWNQLQEVIDAFFVDTKMD